MKTQVKKQDKCQVQLNITLDENEVKGVVAKVEAKFLKEAQLPGFRKGKVPLALIRKEFAESLASEVKRTAFAKFYPVAIQEEKIREFNLLTVEKLDVTDKGAEMTALVEVLPEFKLPAYKGLKIEDKKTPVTDADVKEMISRLRTACAKYEDAKDGDAAATGDFVQIDYEGRVGEEKILDIDPEAKIVGQGTGYWTQVLDGRFLPEIIAALPGMKVGETKTDIAASFDTEAAPEKLKGKKAVYTITLKSLRKQILPTDEALLKDAKVESMEALEKTYREGLEKAAERREHDRREQDVLEQLAKKADFDIPESQVQRMTEFALNDYITNAKRAGLDNDFLEKSRDEIIKNARASAETRVRLHYILEEIAKEEKIEASDAERGEKVVAFILENAKVS